MLALDSYSLLKEARMNKLWQYLFLLIAVNEQEYLFLSMLQYIAIGHNWQLADLLSHKSEKQKVSQGNTVLFGHNKQMRQS